MQYDRGLSTAARIDLESQIGAANAQDFPLIDARVLHLPSQQAAEALGRSPGVRLVEADLPRRTTATPNDYWWPSQWGPVKTGSTTAWDQTTGDPGTVIAILDTGVETAHPDLSDKLVKGWDFVNNDSDPADDHGHGTFAAGVAAAQTNNGVGVAGYCWSCRIMPVKVLGANGVGYDSVIASAVRWSADNGARVISMSLGGTASSTTLSSAVAYAIGKGVVVAAAAGNDSSTTVNYPAGYSGVLAVAATNSQDGLYSWSNHGSWITVGAPGCNYSTGPLGAYNNFCGTSSATPAVAGAAAAVLRPGDGLTPQAVRQAIVATAAPIGADWPGGRLDAAALTGALLSAAPAPPPPGSAPEPTLDTTPPTSPVLTSKANKTGITLSWTASSDNVGLAAYLVTRDGVALSQLSPSTTSLKDSGATAGSHAYQVWAVDTSSNSAASNTVLAAVSTTGPGRK